MENELHERKVAWFTPAKELTRKDGADAADSYLRGNRPKTSDAIPWFVGVCLIAVAALYPVWSKF